MKQEKTQAVKKVKSLVKRMLTEREGLVNQASKETLLPSEYWSDYCKYFKYLLDLSEEHFSSLRNHTFHLTGDSYSEYMPPRDIREKNYQKAFDILWSRVPQRYRLSEPQEDYGFCYKEHCINRDVRRYQEVVNVLYAQGILQELDKDYQSRNILEIGGGFGGLIHHLHQSLAIRDGDKFFIIDLPEVLLFSASYLCMHQDEKLVYLYDSETIDEVRNSGYKDYKFVLLPSYKISDLNQCNFNLIINMASFQEMHGQQVKEYLNFIESRLKGYLLSYNRDVNIDQNSQGINLKKALAKRFNIEQIDKVKAQQKNFKSKIYSWLRLVVRKWFSKPKENIIPGSTDYKLYICTSRVL